MQRDLLRRSLVRSLRLELLEDRHLMAALTDDAYEQNDTLATAKNLGEISTTRTIANLVQADAHDWYRFNITKTAGSAASASIVFQHARGDLDLEVYSSTGSRLRISQGISGSEVISLAGFAPGTYYVHVYGYRGVTNPNYSLAINPSTTVTPTDDAYENNDTQATASNLGTLTTSTSLPNLALLDAADWYRFTTTSTGTSANSVSISFQNAQGNLALQLVNSSGTVLATANGIGNTESISLSGRAAGTYFVRVYSATGARNPNYSLQIAAPGAAVLPPNTSTSGSGAFDIQIQYVGFTPSQRAIFERAAARWEAVIVGDLPNAIYNGVVVDDLLINASATAIDGVGGTLGQAGYDRTRLTGTRLPYHGSMQFDTADLASMEANGSLLNVIVHEIGHVLGFGTLWQAKGLLVGAGTSNPVFIGRQAVAAYNAVFGTNVTGVQVENGGGSGTRDSHWRESTFQNELMTGYIDSGSNPFSRVTIASLADLGYTVNLAAADSFARPAGSSSTVSTSTSGGGSTANLLSPDAAASPTPIFNPERGFVGCLCRQCTGAAAGSNSTPVRGNDPLDPLVALWSASQAENQPAEAIENVVRRTGHAPRPPFANALELLLAGEQDWTCVAST